MSIVESNYFETNPTDELNKTKKVTRTVTLKRGEKAEYNRNVQKNIRLNLDQV